MHLTVVGSSPAWPNPGGAQSGYLVEHEGGSVLLDCGPGVLGRLRESSAWPEPDSIVITHFHLDHWGDLVPWVWGALHRAGAGHRVPTPELWVPPGGTAVLEQFGGLLGFSDMFARVFALRVYEPGEPFVAGGLDVIARVVPHYRMQAHALRLQQNGTTLAYSGDSGPSAALAETARDADLFVCEATLLGGDLDGEPRGHLSIPEAVAAFEDSGARSLLLTHRPQELARPDGLTFAHDGLVVEL